MKDTILDRKYNISDILNILIYLFSISFFIISNYFLFCYSTRIIINLYLIIFIQCFIFIVFGLDIVSSISFLVALVIVPSASVYFHKVFELGDLTFNLSILPIKMYQITYYTLIFMLLWSFIAYIFKIKMFESRIINAPVIKNNIFTIDFNNFVAVIFSFIAFPTLPKMTLNINEVPIGDGLLPGHAWNQLVIVALLFNLPYLKQHLNVILTYLFVIMWFILHGERADISGLLFGLVIVISLSKNVSLVKKAFSFVMFLIVVVFFIDIKSHFQYSIFKSLIHICTFGTVSDISYVFNTSINYVNNFGYMHGKMFLSMLESIVPSVGGFCNIGSIFNGLYLYPGGGSIISTPLLDGGIIGIELYTLVYLFLLKFVITRKSPIIKYELLALICSIPRISWYGTNYIFSSMLFFVPLMYLIDRYINNKESVK